MEQHICQMCMEKLRKVKTGEEDVGKMARQRKAFWTGGYSLGYMGW